MAALGPTAPSGGVQMSGTGIETVIGTGSEIGTACGTGIAIGTGEEMGKGIGTGTGTGSVRRTEEEAAWTETGTEKGNASGSGSGSGTGGLIGRGRGSRPAAGLVPAVCRAVAGSQWLPLRVTGTETTRGTESVTWTGQVSEGIETAIVTGTGGERRRSMHGSWSGVRASFPLWSLSGL